ncbi:2-methylaconitate cis-trans isomerase PrpF family protein [Roseomonas sp. CCTCC AB2023176]|uniref:2-methylaconitate cis-trans isomerase PrpF family protein n=1 Tax=Roseomonas sp. CCTCC AB2023176 TaxID=3342640 RepID=UPI0035E02686
MRPIPAAFYRGGTSKAVMFHARDLPADRAEWAPLFTALMGSPDPYGRQLDGMGGGVSSLSKVCVIGPSTRDDADLDYTFAQVQVRETCVGYRSNCGNMSSAIGPFAVDEGLVHAPGDTATVRIHNTNTRKIIRATFPVLDGRTRGNGDLAIPGVAGTGAPIRLDFLEPGGASTGRLLPTGNPRDVLDVGGIGRLEASLVDAANACVFLRAADLGLTGRELPDEIESRPDLLARFAAIRAAGSVAMGIAPDLAAARAISAIPFIGVVAPPAPFRSLTGEEFTTATHDLAARILSNGQPHRALPLTISLCAAVAARIDGTLVHEATGRNGASLRIGMPSGVLTVAAEVTRDPAGAWQAESGGFYRTARRLFDGQVWVPGATGHPS